ncbi:MAG: aspartate/glutamate racemase family protein [Granulosicoccus sp.]
MVGFKRIGVLGGMGPQATILLQQRLVTSIRAEDDASHIPLLIDMNPQIPSRLDWILKQEGRDPGPVLVDMAKTLESAGACALAMPCNTAHYYAPQITAAVSIPLLNMITLAAQAIVQSAGEGARVGILASPATQGINLFKDAFVNHGLEVIYPDLSEPLLAAIRRIKSQGATDKDYEALQNAGQDCQQQGANCLLVGCSEFSLIADAVDGTLPMIDSMDVLVREIVAFSSSE